MGKCIIHTLNTHIMNNAKLGRLTTIKNTEKTSTEAELYIRVWVEDSNGGNERPLFLTQKEFERINKRTEKNKEDWGKRGFFQDLLD